MVMIAKGFKKIFQKHPKFKGIWKGSLSKRNKRNPKGTFFSKDDTNQNTSYGCGLSDHMIKDCPNIKKKIREPDSNLKEKKK